jgi:hypothetical protein
VALSGQRHFRPSPDTVTVTALIPRGPAVGFERTQRQRVGRASVAARASEVSRWWHVLRNLCWHGVGSRDACALPASRRFDGVLTCYAAWACWLSSMQSDHQRASMKNERISLNRRAKVRPQGDLKTNRRRLHQVNYKCGRPVFEDASTRGATGGIGAEGHRERRCVNHDSTRCDDRRA